MSDYQDQDNQFEEIDDSPTSRPAPTGTRNRGFFIAIGLIGTIFVIALIALLITLFVQAPQQASQSQQQADIINAQNTAVAATATADQLRVIQLQQTLDAGAKAPPPTATQPAVTSTSVLAIPTATSTPTPTVSAEMATQTALAETQAAVGTNVGGYPGSTTGTPGTPGVTPTGLPTTGFADEVGLPGLFGLAAILIAVIILARRARTAH
jgi:cytoskeletal protein RodZ